LTRILLLGGTTEASELARRLAHEAEFDVTLSLAGRTLRPQAQPLATRSGGFGGVEGLQRWIEAHGIAAVLDATHPYAVRISANTVAACAAMGIPLGSIVRPPWTKVTGDTWIETSSAEAAARALGEAPRRVFLSLGRLELAAFVQAPQHSYLVRSIDVPAGLPLNERMRLIQARGPFCIEDELELLRREQIDIVVSKNSGGTATYAKIEAARRLGLPVVMLTRPYKPADHPLASVDAAITWLKETTQHHLAPGSLRGV
jgi:precorrin-6A/cobalt-precorrin-6A reductase